MNKITVIGFCVSFLFSSPMKASQNDSNEAPVNQYENSSIEYIDYTTADIDKMNFTHDISNLYKSYRRELTNLYKSYNESRKQIFHEKDDENLKSLLLFDLDKKVGDVKFIFENNYKKEAKSIINKHNQPNEVFKDCLRELYAINFEVINQICPKINKRLIRKKVTAKPIAANKISKLRNKFTYDQEDDLDLNYKTNKIQTPRNISYLIE